MNAQLAGALASGAAALQNRRRSLVALAAMALATAPLSPVKAANKQKSCNKVRKKALKEADLKCQ
jgi:hypothetical protein